MSRALAIVPILLLGILALAGVASHAAAAHDAAPPVLAAHPLVGAWMLGTNTADPTTLPPLMIFDADGTSVGADLGGRDTVGTWEATGSRTAALTLMAFAPGEGGAFGDMVKLRGAVEVAADGQSFTASSTVELMAPNGGGAGQFGLATGDLAITWWNGVGSSSDRSPARRRATLPLPGYPIA